MQGGHQLCKGVLNTHCEWEAMPSNLLGPSAMVGYGG